jgi:putative membrane protein
MNTTTTKNYTPLIIALSIILPAAVAILYFGPKLKIEGFDLKILPAINALINGFTALILIAGFFAIKNKNIALHRKLMTSAIVFSILFLLLYVLYHASAEATKFGGEGSIRYVYYFLLITHIILAVAIVPLVLITYVRALSEKFDRHRKIAKITLPLWLYVSVIVYLMIRPYY